MDWNRIEGAWKEFRGKAKSQWGQLTDDDLNQISGNKDMLIGKLQSRYGYSKDIASAQVKRWLDDMGSEGMMAKATEAKDQALYVVNNFGGALQRSVRDAPGATLALTALVGFALGALWKA
jgi:uncharacterized protein YjbJ (UPF0337 family)